MYFRKVSIKERSPELGKFVTTIDTAGEHRVYRLTENGWNMRDSDGTNSPNNNLPIEYWLEEFELSNVEEKAAKWDALDETIGGFYADDVDEDERKKYCCQVGIKCTSASR